MPVSYRFDSELGCVHTRCLGAVTFDEIRDDALFGMSRMFEVFAEPQFERTRVFRDASIARNWLAQSGGSA